LITTRNRPAGGKHSTLEPKASKFVDGFKGFSKRKDIRMLTPEAREKAKKARRARRTRREKMAAFAETFAMQRADFPRMALPIIQRAERGSLPDAIKLKCLDCVAWERKEVRDCVIVACPLYPHRPYQRIKGKNPNDPAEL
jgi:hypothetical protein